MDFRIISEEEAKRRVPLLDKIEKRLKMYEEGKITRIHLLDDLADMTTSETSKNPLNNSDNSL